MRDGVRSDRDDGRGGKRKENSYGGTGISSNNFGV